MNMTRSFAVPNAWRATFGSPSLRAMSALVLIGVVLRLWHWLGGRSLWLDEAMVANSIVGRDWAGLLQPLDEMQMAPIGWLFVERAAYLFIGHSDLVLRLPQLAAGIAALALFAFAMRHMLGTAGSLIAVALFALSPELVRYTAEVKPYGIDAFVAVASIAMMSRYMFGNVALSARNVAALAAGGVLAIMLSLAAAFILAGCGIALALREAFAHRWRNLAGLVLVGASWLGVFAWLFLRTSLHSQNNVVDFMQGYWSDAFAPFPPTSMDDLKWYLFAVVRIFDYAFGVESRWPAIVACSLGAVIAFRRNWLFGLALIAPVILAFATSLLDLYPPRDRLILFTLPALFVFIGFGIDAVYGGVQKKVIAAAMLACLLLAGSLQTLWGAFNFYSVPFGAEDIRPLLNRVADHREKDEPIYVNFSGLPAFRYYAGSTGLQDAQIIEGREMRSNTVGCVLADVVSISAQPRAWIVHAHPQPAAGPPPQEDVVLVYAADVVGHRIERIDHQELHAYLYAFDPGATEKAAAMVRALPPQLGCNHGLQP